MVRAIGYGNQPQGLPPLPPGLTKKQMQKAIKSGQLPPLPFGIGQQQLGSNSQSNNLGLPPGLTHDKIQQAINSGQQPPPFLGMGQQGSGGQLPPGLTPEKIQEAIKSGQQPPPFLGMNGGFGGSLEGNGYSQFGGFGNQGLPQFGSFGNNQGLPQGLPPLPPGLTQEQMQQGIASGQRPPIPFGLGQQGSYLA